MTLLTTVTQPAYDVVTRTGRSPVRPQLCACARRERSGDGPRGTHKLTRQGQGQSLTPPGPGDTAGKLLPHARANENTQPHPPLPTTLSTHHGVQGGPGEPQKPRTHAASLGWGRRPAGGLSQLTGRHSRAQGSAQPGLPFQPRAKPSGESLHPSDSCPVKWGQEQAPELLGDVQEGGTLCRVRGSTTCTLPPRGAQQQPRWDVAHEA